MTGLGVVLFHTTSSALRAEKVLLGAGLRVKLIPTPRQFSSDCGLALRFDWEQVEAVRGRLEEAGAEYAEVRALE
ncbi:MAG: DUF3343 domain-containing protein [Anaerolineae bacterium]|nr:DUF3343 domain-containing protein [Anaerolineae bacterium]